MQAAKGGKGSAQSEREMATSGFAAHATKLTMIERNVGPWAWEDRHQLLF